MKSKKEKIKKYGWELNTGMYEIFWVNDIATKVRIEGVIFVFKKLAKKNRK